jgi:potassium efflux system protein
VQDLLLKVAEHNQRVVADPAPAVFCVGLGDSGIDFEVRAFIEDVLDYMPLAHELYAAITRALSDAGVVIPFPQQDLHVRSLIDSKPDAAARHTRPLD